SSSQSHTAQSLRSITVHYPWHPFWGQRLTVARSHRTATGERAFVCVAPAGGFVVVSEWMTERERCVRMRLAEARQVSLTALLELHTLLRSIASAPDRHGTIGADGRPALIEEARHHSEDAD